MGVTSLQSTIFKYTSEKNSPVANFILIQTYKLTYYNFIQPLGIKFQQKIFQKWIPESPRFEKDEERNKKFILYKSYSIIYSRIQFNRKVGRFYFFGVEKHASIFLMSYNSDRLLMPEFSLSAGWSVRIPAKVFLIVSGRDGRHSAVAFKRFGRKTEFIICSLSIGRKFLCGAPASNFCFQPFKRLDEWEGSEQL